jgi:transposase-like protein
MTNAEKPTVSGYEAEMEDSEILDFIVRMKRKARRAADGTVTRIHYTDDDRCSAIKLLDCVESRGGSLADVAELLSVNKSTLQNWLGKFTEPGTNWHLKHTAQRLSSALLGVN